MRLLDLFCGAGGCSVGPDTELAWAAGFFDGEGYVGVTRDKRWGRGPKLQLSIEQVDPRPLHRFVAAVGRGKVTQRSSKRAPNRKVIHRVHLASAATAFVMAVIWPWLSEPKREQFTRCLRALEEAGHAIT